MTTLKGVIIWSVILYSTTLIKADRRSNDLYSGLIGCRFSSSVCLSTEECFDDNLFGNCQKAGSPSPDLYRYNLSNRQLSELQSILHRLAASGYTWHNLYTQCLLTTALLAYRLDVSLDLDFCDLKTLRGLAEDRKQNKFTFLNDLVDMLAAKNTLEDNQDQRMSEEKPHSIDSSAREPASSSPYDSSSPRNDYNDFLGTMTRDDLELLKEFLVEQGNKRKFPQSSQPAAKRDPAIEQFNSSVDNISITEGTSNQSTEVNNRPITTSYSDEPVTTTTTRGGEPATTAYNIKPPVVNNLFLDDSASYQYVTRTNVKQSGGETKYLIVIYILSALAFVLLIIAVILFRKHRQSLREDQAEQFSTLDSKDENCNDYEDLCRQHMHSQLSERTEILRYDKPAQSKANTIDGTSVESLSTWDDDVEPLPIDISAGHMILSYMEEHLNDKDKLQKEWEELCNPVPESPQTQLVAVDLKNALKNRYMNLIPYDNSRIVLKEGCDLTGSDYINASKIIDADRNNPVYIATQGPMSNTVTDFWQMVWESGSVVIVNLTCLTENGEVVCHRYWPDKESDRYHIYEVQTVSEHSQCDDYIVRNFSLKNCRTNDTRLVSQFHFLSWPDQGIPANAKKLLDFRRKVNRCYRGESSPIIVHCSDGAGRTGTYCLIDLVLNRLRKGAKEIDIAATLEYIRDQRPNMVSNKEQLEFALIAVAEEVRAMLQSPIN